jgi:hypothetical protein
MNLYKDCIIAQNTLHPLNEIRIYFLSHSKGSLNDHFRVPLNNPINELTIRVIEVDRAGEGSSNVFKKAFGRPTESSIISGVNRG